MSTTVDRRALTAARRAAEPGPAGCLLLASGHVEWRDGEEVETAAALARVADRSDLSDELAGQVSSWATRCHFGRERGHIVRAFAPQGDARVLEVGAGCGPVTRTLGERYAVVDALEPVAERAAIARARTGDLDSVEVLIGTVDDLPLEAEYDLIVVVGVLEYIGGSAGAAPRAEFLRSLARRLAPGGHIACAIENRLGAAYFCGQPEEHTGVLFEGIEGYRRGSPVRTFARPELEALFRSAGLEPQVLHVMPEYRFPRIVFSDDLLDSPAQPLAWRVPHFPTATAHRRVRLADERSLWRSFCEAGIGGAHANSHLVLARASGAPDLWPAGQLAVFWSHGRRRRYATESRVIARGAGIVMDREQLSQSEPDGAGELLHTGGTIGFVPGEALCDALADGSPAKRRELLAAWVGSVRRTADAAGGVPLDHVPANLVLSEGRLVDVDVEFADARLPADEVIRHGLITTALELADRAPPERWPVSTVGALVGLLAVEAGLSPPDLDRAGADEAALVALVTGGPPGSREHAQARARAEVDFAARFAQPLARTALGVRDVAPPNGSVKPADLGAALARAEADRDAAERDTAAWRRRADALAGIAESRSWRLTRPLRAAAARLRRIG